MLSLYHKLLPGQALPPDLSLAQLLVLLHERGMPSGQASLDFTLSLNSRKGAAQAKSDQGEWQHMLLV